MEVVMSIILCFFAVYGVFQILYNIACKISKSELCFPQKMHRVIFADKNADKLEGYIRYLALREEKEKIIIIPAFDNDDAEGSRLIEILCAEFDNVDSMTLEEYAKYIKE